jgi:predicted transcriptional regulator
MSDIKTIKNETNVEDLTTNKNKILNEFQASQLIGISQQTLRQSIRYKGLIPYYKVGTRVAYRVNDVLDYLKKCRVESTN